MKTVLEVLTETRVLLIVVTSVILAAAGQYRKRFEYCGTETGGRMILVLTKKDRLRKAAALACGVALVCWGCLGLALDILRGLAR